MKPGLYENAMKLAYERKKVAGMQDDNFAENAGHGVSDISGVNGAVLSRPEGEENGVLRVAAGENTEEIGEAGPRCGADAASLDSEFEELIKGRFREAYRRRTESIIRKRLRAGKARPARDAAAGSEGVENGIFSAPERISDNKSAENAEFSGNGALGVGNAGGGEDAVFKDGNGGSDTSEGQSERLKKALEEAVTRNRTRPVENGCGGSCGVVTRINVSALSGSDVMSILKRVGAGEKISFK